MESDDEGLYNRPDFYQVIHELECDNAHVDPPDQKGYRRYERGNLIKAVTILHTRGVCVISSRPSLGAYGCALVKDRGTQSIEMSLGEVGQRT